MHPRVGRWVRCGRARSSASERPLRADRKRSTGSGPHRHLVVGLFLPDSPASPGTVHQRVGVRDLCCALDAGHRSARRIVFSIVLMIVQIAAGPDADDLSGADFDPGCGSGCRRLLVRLRGKTVFGSKSATFVNLWRVNPNETRGFQVAACQLPHPVSRPICSCRKRRS